MIRSSDGFQVQKRVQGERLGCRLRGVASSFAWCIRCSVMLPMPPPEPEHPKPVPPNPTKVIFPVSVFLITMFFFCFDAGKFYVDHLQHIDMTMSMGMSLAGVWTITRVLKIRKQARERITLFSIIAVLLIPSIIGGFLTGKEVQYPAESRALVENIDEHVGQVKSIKEHIGQVRGSFTEPEQLLSIQPLVKSWEEHLDQISRLDHEIMHDALPSFIAGVLKIMNEELVLDKRQVQNINERISVIRAANNLHSSRKAQLYKQQLVPLMDQEQQIERQRQDSNFGQRIKDLAKNSGYK